VKITRRITIEPGDFKAVYNYATLHPQN